MLRIDLLEKKKLKKKQESELRLRSLPIKRNLPRPNKINIHYGNNNNNNINNNNENEIEGLIKQEMVNMVIFDAVHHPQPGQHKTLGKEGIEYLAKINYDSFTEEELNTARNLLEKEQEIVEEENQFYDDELENAIYEKIWNNAFGNVVFAPHEKNIWKNKIWKEIKRWKRRKKNMKIY